MLRGIRFESKFLLKTDFVIPFFHLFVKSILAVIYVNKQVSETD
jgi:hypothetical protein